jgi:hypothetical protein
MFLRIKQWLCGKQITEFEPRIYSNGVFLIPMSIELNGKISYVWVADEFNDDIFGSDGNSISVKVIADAIEDLCQLKYS